MGSSTERKTQGGFALALACLAVIAAVSWLALDRFRANAAWVEHTYEVMSRLEELFSMMTDAQNGHRGYALTGDERFIDPYLQAVKTAPAELRELQALTADNPAQQRRIKSLVTLVYGLLERSREIIEIRRTQGLDAAQRETLSGKGKQLHDEFRRLIDEMKADESALLKTREAQELRSAKFTQTVIVGMGAVAFAFPARPRQCLLH